MRDAAAIPTMSACRCVRSGTARRGRVPSFRVRSPRVYCSSAYVCAAAEEAHRGGRRGGKSEFGGAGNVGGRATGIREVVQGRGRAGTVAGRRGGKREMTLAAEGEVTYRAGCGHGLCASCEG